MAGNIWDNGMGLGEQFGLSFFPNIKYLFKRMPYEPEDPESQAMGTKLKAAFKDTSFASKLNAGLANKDTRDEIARLAREDHAGLAKVLEVAVRNPSGLDAAVADARPSSGSAAPKVAAAADQPATTTESAPAKGGAAKTAFSTASKSKKPPAARKQQAVSTPDADADTEEAPAPMEVLSGNPGNSPIFTMIMALVGSFLRQFFEPEPAAPTGTAYAKNDPAARNNPTAPT